MKRLIIFLLICLLIFTSCSVTNTKSSSNTDYKVKKIESNHFLYIIDVTRNDSTFRVISPKENFDESFEKIKVGRKYPLNLLQLYPNEFVVGKDNEAKGKPKDFIDINKKTHYKLYIASNLNGLYISDIIKDTEELIKKFGVFTFFCDACKKKKYSYILYMK